MTVIASFDPGQTGAVAILHGSELIEVIDLPVIDKRINAPLLHREMELWQPKQVVIEALHAMPVNGSKANFSQGYSAGVIAGVCSAYPVAYLTPTSWKKQMKITGSRDEQKEKARLRCIELWPAQAEKFKLKKHADRADACLIGLAWAQQQEIQA